MNKRAIYVCATSLGLLGAILLAPHGLQWIGAWGVSTHQRNVTRELATWESEYGRVRTWQDARRAIDMMEYAQNYYVVGPGYRGDKTTEAKLEAQREQTLHAILFALNEFTGADFGPDVSKWRDWISNNAK